jgi:hypothetical protein
MKTILKTLFFLPAFSASMVYGSVEHFAPTVATLRIEKVSAAFKKVSVELSGYGGAVTLSLQQANGEVLLQENIAPGGNFGKVLDLSQLTAGEYRIVVASELKETVQPLRITSADVVMREEYRREYFAPVARLKGRDLDLNWFNTQVATLELAILEADGTELFVDTLQGVVRIERRYKLNDLQRGSYTLRMSTPYKTYYQTIALY